MGAHRSRRQRDDALGHFGAALTGGDEAAVSRLLRLIVERVLVRQGEIEIVWR